MINKYYKGIKTDEGINWIEINQSEYNPNNKNTVAVHIPEDEIVRNQNGQPITIDMNAKGLVWSEFYQLFKLIGIIKE